MFCSDQVLLVVKDIATDHVLPPSILTRTSAREDEYILLKLSNITTLTMIILKLEF